VVVAQVEDQGIGIGYEGHRCDRRLAAFRGTEESVELDVADVACQHLDLVEGAVGALRHLLVQSQLLGGWGRVQVIGQPRGHETHRQMFVVTDVTQVRGEEVSKLVAFGDSVVVAVLLVTAQGFAHLLGEVGRDVALL
jgi:hypothetical protein